MTVTSLWIGDKLPDIQKLCIKSFLDHGHQFELYTYKQFDGIPEGTIVKDANAVIPESDIYRDVGQNSYGPFADWWSYKWLYENGGFWVDMDIVCVSDKLPEKTPYAVKDELNTVCHGALHFEPKDKLMLELKELAEDPIGMTSWDMEADDYATLQYRKELANIYSTNAERRANVIFGYIGPRMMTAAYNYFKYTPESEIDIFPISQKYWQAIYNGDIRLKDLILDSSWGIHLWGELYRINYTVPTENSLLYELMRKHDITPEPGRTSRNAISSYKYEWEGKEGTIYMYTDGTFESDNDPEFKGTQVIDMRLNKGTFTFVDGKVITLPFQNAPKDYTLNDWNGHVIYAIRPYVL